MWGEIGWAEECWEEIKYCLDGVGDGEEEERENFDW
jgi:hypothetical protein